MRLLLLDHEFAPQGDGEPVAILELAAELRRQGHDVRMLAVTAQSVATTTDMTVIVCSPDDPGADLRIRCPRVEHPGPHEQSFRTLSPSDSAAYRELLRRMLDEEIARFDPQCCHALQTWIFGQLALESGVPYVLSVGRAELSAAADDPVFGPLAEQAAENATALFVNSATVAAHLNQQFPHIEPTHIKVITGLYESPTAHTCEELAAHYATAWQRRSGGAV